MRFVPPLAALADGPSRSTATERARQRPIGPVLDALRGLGVDVDAADRRPAPLHRPRHRRGARRRGRRSTRAASSQFVTALLLAGCAYEDGPAGRRRRADAAVRAAHRDDGRDARRRGVPVDHEPAPQVWRVEPGPAARRPASSSSPTCPTRAVRRRRPGHRRPGRGRRLPGGSARSRRGGARPLLTAFGAGVGGPRRPARSSSTGPAGSRGADELDLPADRRAHAGDRRARRARPPAPPRSAASPTCAATRPTGSPRWPRRSTPLGGDVHRDRRRAGDPPGPLHGGRLRDLRRPPAGHRRRRPRAGRPGRRVVDVATTAKTLPGFVDLLARDARAPRLRQRTGAARPRRGRRPRPPGPRQVAAAHQGPPRARRGRRRLGRHRRPRPVHLPGRRGAPDARTVDRDEGARARPQGRRRRRPGRPGR